MYALAKNRSRECYTGVFIKPLVLIGCGGGKKINYVDKILPRHSRGEIKSL